MISPCTSTHFWRQIDGSTLEQGNLGPSALHRSLCRKFYSFPRIPTPSLVVDLHDLHGPRATGEDPSSQARDRVALSMSLHTSTAVWIPFASGCCGLWRTCWYYFNMDLSSKRELVRCQVYIFIHIHTYIHVLYIYCIYTQSITEHGVLDWAVRRLNCPPDSWLVL